MPKKFQGDNSKAAVARARKEEQKVEEREKKAAAEEDEKWRDADKHVLRKQMRKAEKEAKLHERSERRAELRVLHDQEMEDAAPRPEAPEKVTRAAIEARRAEVAAGATRAAAAATPGVQPQPELEENFNRLVLDGEHARTVDEALRVLGAEPESDRHPEKRMRAAYAAFEERELARLKQELPGMRLSQLKQLVHKSWDKSPENPRNQRNEAVASN